VLLAWTLSNGLLAAAVVTATEKNTVSANNAVSGYMAFVLYSVAGLACTSLSLLSCPRRAY
jgi:chitin synthase